MNSHSRRLIVKTIHSLEKYNEGKIDKFGLMDDLSGHCGAIEEPEIQEATKTLVLDVDHALWTLDEPEVMAFICERLGRLKMLCD